MLVLDAYSYLFYRLYRFSSRWKRDVAPPHFKAFVGMVAIVWCSIFLLLEIIETIIAPHYSVISHLSKLEIYVSFGLLALPLYFAFLHRKRYEQIVKRYQSETPRQRLVRGMVIVISLFLLWALGVSFALLHTARIHASIASNQSMKPTAPFQNTFSVFATTPCRGLSVSR